MSPDERLIWYRIRYDETGKKTVSCGCACLPIVLGLLILAGLIWWALH